LQPLRVDQCDQIGRKFAIGDSIVYNFSKQGPSFGALLFLEKTPKHRSLWVEALEQLGHFVKTVLVVLSSNFPAKKFVSIGC
jgi:hypothetical protein